MPAAHSGRKSSYGANLTSTLTLLSFSNSLTRSRMSWLEGSTKLLTAQKVMVVGAPAGCSAGFAGACVGAGAAGAAAAAVAAGCAAGDAGADDVHADSPMRAIARRTSRTTLFISFPLSLVRSATQAKLNAMPRSVSTTYTVGDHLPCRVHNGPPTSPTGIPRIDQQVDHQGHRNLSRVGQLQRKAYGSEGHAIT